MLFALLDLVEQFHRRHGSRRSTSGCALSVGGGRVDVLTCYGLTCYVLTCYGLTCYGLMCYGLMCYVLACYGLAGYVLVCYVLARWCTTRNASTHQHATISYLLAHFTTSGIFSLKLSKRGLETPRM